MEQQQAPFFTRFLEGQKFPRVQTGLRGGTGAEFTYIPSGPNSAILGDIEYPDPLPPEDPTI